MNRWKKYIRSQRHGQIGWTVFDSTKGIVGQGLTREDAEALECGLSDTMQYKACEPQRRAIRAMHSQRY